MLKKGLLAGSQVATSYAYDKKTINKYLKEADRVFKNKFLYKKGKFLAR